MTGSTTQDAAADVSAATGLHGYSTGIDAPKITVRFVNDHKTGKCWFEEQLRDQWVQIRRTVMSCEGNSRLELEKEIEERRQQRLLIHRTYSKPQEFAI